MAPIRTYFCALLSSCLLPGRISAATLSARGKYASLIAQTGPITYPCRPEHLNDYDHFLLFPSLNSGLCFSSYLNNIPTSFCFFSGYITQSPLRISCKPPQILYILSPDKSCIFPFPHPSPNPWDHQLTSSPTTSTPPSAHSRRT